MTNVTHTQAFRAQAAFAPEAKLTILGNLWRPGTPGGRFFEQVLSQNPTTVGECIEKAAALAEPLTATAVQGHLRWAFTANGAFLEIDGQRFAAPPAVENAKVEKPKPVKVAKTKKPKKAEAMEQAA
jgi:hypothetical protein